MSSCTSQRKPGSMTSLNGLLTTWSEWTSKFFFRIFAIFYLFSEHYEILSMTVDLIVYTIITKWALWGSLHRCKSFLQKIAKPTNCQICFQCNHNKGLQSNGVSLSMSFELGTTTIIKENGLLFAIDFIFKDQRHNNHSVAVCLETRTLKPGCRSS